MKTFLSAFIAGILPASILMFSIQTSLADSATWNLNPISSDWNDPLNWTPPTVPNGPTDMATFDLSNLTAISVGQTIITLDSIIFNPDASAFTITVGPQAGSSLVIVGSGITNNSGVTQNFATTNSANFGAIGTIEFHNEAIAGSGLVFTNNAGLNGERGGVTKFWENSSAGDASFINIGGISEGSIEFHDNSTAGNATFDNGPSGDTNGGFIVFSENATAGNGYFINEGKVFLGGFIEFGDNSTAGTATFVNMRGVQGTEGAEIDLTLTVIP
jgi:hypothetical protein